jgi:hypothetical protein
MFNRQTNLQAPLLEDKKSSTNIVIEINETAENIQTLENVGQQIHNEAKIHRAGVFVSFMGDHCCSISILLSIGALGSFAVMLTAMEGNRQGFMSETTAEIAFFTGMSSFLTSMLGYGAVVGGLVHCPQGFSSLPLLNRFFSRNIRLADLTARDQKLQETVAQYNSITDINNAINNDTPLIEAIKRISDEKRINYDGSHAAKFSHTLFKTLSFKDDGSRLLPPPITRIIAEYVIKDEQAIKKAEESFKKKTP